MLFNSAHFWTESRNKIRIKSLNMQIHLWAIVLPMSVPLAAFCVISFCDLKLGFLVWWRCMQIRELLSLVNTKSNSRLYDRFAIWMRGHWFLELALCALWATVVYMSCLKLLIFSISSFHLSHWKTIPIESCLSARTVFSCHRWPSTLRAICQFSYTALNRA